MKTWLIEIEVDTEDDVTREDMKGVAEKIADDAAIRCGDEIAGETSVMLGNVSC